jgi:hypothetical protein
MIQGFSSGLLNRELIYQTDLPSFQRDFASLKSLNHGTGPNITFTRASNATYFDADGVLQTATNDTPRFDHSATGSSLGLLIEEARTNSIRNSQAGGSTAGAPGTMPTNWSKSANVNGISSEVIGAGTESGLSYLDVKVSGTPTSSANFFLFFESSTQIVAANTQTWCGSAYIKLAGGSVTNATTSLTRRGLDASGVQVSGQDETTTFVASSSGLHTQRVVTPVSAFSSASVERVNIFLRIAYTNGNPIDLTLRIAAPQLEQGAFPTSYIPTTTAAATRAADSAVVTPISSFYNQAEGTTLAEYSFPEAIPSSGFPHIYSFSDGGSDANNVRLIGTATTNPFIVRVGGTDQANIGSSAVVAGTIYRNAGAYRQDAFAASRNGGAVGTDTSGTVPSGMTHLRLGAAGSTANRFTGHIRKIAYWPKRLTNTLLEQLTT